MASSSVSQESLDREEYDVAARRSRVRALRVRGGPGRVAEDTPEVAGGPDDAGEGVAAEGLDQDSPSRAGARASAKDKRRPNHLHKGKTVKDKRKLREKRRSTGVVHLPSEVSEKPKVATCGFHFPTEERVGHFAIRVIIENVIEIINR